MWAGWCHRNHIIPLGNYSSHSMSALVCPICRQSLPPPTTRMSGFTVMARRIPGWRKWEIDLVVSNRLNLQHCKFFADSGPLKCLLLSRWLTTTATGSSEPISLQTDFMHHSLSLKLHLLLNQLCGVMRTQESLIWELNWIFLNKIPVPTKQDWQNTMYTKEFNFHTLPYRWCGLCDSKEWIDFWS